MIIMWFRDGLVWCVINRFNISRYNSDLQKRIIYEIACFKVMAMKLNSSFLYYLKAFKIYNLYKWMSIFNKIFNYLT